MGSKAVSPERESFTHPAYASSLVKQAARHLGVRGQELSSRMSRRDAMDARESSRGEGCSFRDMI